MAINYRKVDTNDVPELVRLRLEFLDEAATYTAEQRAILRVTITEYITSSLLDGSLAVFVAEDGGKIVATSGIAFYRHFPNNHYLDGRKAYIANMYTLPEYRKQGIATELMRLQLDEARARGIPSVSLSATDDGRAVYEKIGFKLIDEENTMSLKL